MLKTSPTVALVVLSGGQDSTTCLFNSIAMGWQVHAVTFNYGQRHAAELESARKVFEIAARDHSDQVLSHEVVDVGPILRSASPLVSDNELEQYKDRDSLPGGIEKTFVPMRNQLFLTLAANRAIALGAEVLVTGVCQEDFGGYPDCRQVFIDAVQAAVNLGNEGAAKPIEIDTPLMNLSKAESVQMALDLSELGFNAYGALAYSHTAYDGKYPPTGKDHANLLREKGFAQANVPDPLVLRAVVEKKMDAPVLPMYDRPLGLFLQLINQAGGGEISDEALDKAFGKADA